MLITHVLAYLLICMPEATWSCSLANHEGFQAKNRSLVRDYDLLDGKELLVELNQLTDPQKRLDLITEIVRRHYDVSKETRRRLCLEGLKIDDDRTGNAKSRKSVLHIALGIIELQSGRPLSAQTHLETAIEVSMSSQDTTAEFNARNNLTIAMERNGAAPAKIEEQFEWLLKHKHVASKSSWNSANANYARFLVDTNRKFAAIHRLELAQQNAIEEGDVHAAMISTIMLSNIGIRLELYVQTQAWIANLDNLQKKLPDNERKKIIECQFWTVESHLGRKDEAYRELQKIQANTNPDRFTKFFKCIYLASLSEVLLLMDQPEDALTQAQRSMEAVANLGCKVQFRPATALVKAHIELGQFDEANELLKEYADQFKTAPDILSRLEQRQLRKEAQLHEDAAVEAKQTSERLLLLIILSGFFSLAFVFSWYKFRRQQQDLVLQQEQQLNAELTRLVDRKSESLELEFQQKSELEKQLSEKKNLENLGRLVGNLAHDFNNLLQVIRNANEFMTSQENGAHRDVLDLSNQCVDTAATTIQQLLAYSKNQHLSVENIAFSVYLSEHSRIFHSAVPENIHLLIEDYSCRAKVRIDESEMTNAILNLLSNSCDAMPQGGTIWLYSSTDENQLVVSCKDDGEGISRQNLNRVFEPYFTTKPSHQGTGLGLSSVFGFVQQSGGEISVSSELGEGTEVIMRFPICNEVSNPIESHPTQDSIRLNDVHILVVEDNRFVASCLQAALENSGAKFSCVRTVAEAIQALNLSRDYNFVLSDIFMPRESGMELAKWLQQHRPDTRLVLMSGRAIELENDDIPFLQKPFRTSELMEILASIQRNSQLNNSPVQTKIA